MDTPKSNYNLRKTFSVKRQTQSFRYAFRGIKYVVQNEHNMHIHLLASVCVVLFGFLLQINVTEWCFLVFAIGFVLFAETINTSVELLTDLVSPDFHTLAEKTKDVAAGAVVIASLTAAIIGMLVFLPKIYVLVVDFFFGKSVWQFSFSKK